MVFLIIMYLKPYSIDVDQYEMNPTLCPEIQYQVLIALIAAILNSLNERHHSTLHFEGKMNVLLVQNRN